MQRNKKEPIREYYSELINLPVISILNLKESYPEFISSDDIELNKSFVEWFGVLYGFLLPLILVKVWEQFETLERNFDKEADSIKVFAEDIMLLPGNQDKKKIKLLLIAIEYVKYVQKHYIQEGGKDNDLKKAGDDILHKLRTEMSSFFNSRKSLTNIAPLLAHILSQLNEILDVRGDRISNSKQRLFTGLRPVAVLASLVWLIPFYFLDYELGLYGDGLVLAVTVLIVFVLHKIEDLDEPFYKKWKLDITIWENLENELQSLLATLI